MKAKMKPTAIAITSWHPYKEIIYKCSCCSQNFRILGNTEKFCHNCGTEVDWDNVMTHLPEPFTNKDNYEEEQALIYNINKKQLKEGS